MKQNQALSLLLQKLGLSSDESTIFLSLLDKPKNQLELSRITGIARSSVYRIVDELVQKSLVSERTTSDDKLVMAAKPEALDLLVMQEEIVVEQKRSTLQETITLLDQFTHQEDTVSIHTYRGQAGLRQMLWNELQTKSEICIFSCGSLDTATGREFAEKIRGAIITRDIYQRAIENDQPPAGKIQTAHPNYDKHFEVRFLNPEILNITIDISIHDDIISIYNAFTSDVQVGTEIKNPLLAQFLRQMFEHYWQTARIPNSTK